MRARAGALVAVLALAGCVAPTSAPPGDPGREGAMEPLRPAFPPDAALGATRLFARVGEPGYPEGIAVDGDRVWVTASEEGGTAAEVQGFDLATGALVQRIPVPAPDENPRRILGIAADAQGLLYFTDLPSGRIVRVDPAAPGAQEVYATIPDLPPCATTLPPAPCSPTIEDVFPCPNYIVFGSGGELYVSDLFQATVFRVPPGGGAAEVWFQDARFGSLGPNGLAISPGDTHLYLGQSYLAAPVFATPDAVAGPAGGAVLRLPLGARPTAADLEVVHHYPSGAVDGIAFGASGRLYVTILGQGDAPHGISVLDPQGREVAFFPSDAENARLEVPYRYPASIAFDDARRSILVTNQAFDQHGHWAVLESFVDDIARTLHRPASLG